MPSRCNGCLGGSEGNTKAQLIEFDEFCTNIMYYIFMIKQIEVWNHYTISDNPKMV